MQKFILFFTEIYQTSLMIYTKKAYYAAVLTTLVACMIIFTFPLALQDLGFDPLLVTVLLTILGMAFLSLYLIRRGHLEAAVNILITLGMMRILMLFSDAYAILLYITSAVVIVSFAICQVRRYQIVVPSILVFLIHSAKLWQQVQLYRNQEITQMARNMHFFGFLHVIILEIVGFFLVYIIKSEIQKSEELVDSREQLTQYTRKLQELNILLEDAASRDRLTGAFNRRKMDEIIIQESNKSIPDQLILSMVMFDLDDFKHINDTYGHHVGDEVLARTAQTVLAEIRKTDYLIRWGGEEFLLLLFRETAEGTRDTAERMRHLISEQRYRIPGVHEPGITVTASFGYAIQLENEPLDKQIIRADDAMYEAKRAGKNKVVGR